MYNTNNGLTKRCQDASRPKDLAAERGQEQQAPHTATERILQGVQHRHVALLAHRVREEDAPCRQQD